MTKGTICGPIGAGTLKTHCRFVSYTFGDAQSQLDKRKYYDAATSMATGVTFFCCLQDIAFCCMRPAVFSEEGHIYSTFQYSKVVGL